MPNRQIAAAGLLLVAAAPAVHAQSAPFPDVPANHWAYEALRNLADRGIVKGFPDGKFFGNRALTRYEFASALDRVLQTVAEMARTPPTTAPPAVTQDDLNRIQVLVDTFRNELAAIQSDVATAQSDINALRERLSALEKSVAAAQSTADKAAAAAAKAQATADASYGFGANRKFTIGGFAQVRYERADSGDFSLFPIGTASGNGYNGNYLAGGNASTFKIREARLYFTGAVTPNLRYMAEFGNAGAISTTGTGTAQVFVRRLYGQYTFGDGSPRNLSLTFGQFWLPFGYMINAPRPTWYTPERPLAFNETGAGLFANQEFDRGIKLGWSPGPFSVSLAAVNGSGAISNDTNRVTDFVGRVGYAVNPALSVGVSRYAGKLDIGPTTPRAGALKRLSGADVQVRLPSGPFLQAEYVGGKYEAIPPAIAGTPRIFLPGNKIDGYYLIGGYTFSPRGSHPLSLAVSFDQFRRNRDEDSYTDENVGYGILYNLDAMTRVRFWYEDPRRVAHPPTNPDPKKIGLMTGEMQFRF